MSKTRFAPWVVLACIGTLAGCTSGEDGTVGNTALNIVLPNGCDANGNGSPTSPDCYDIGTVEYTIACDDGDPTPNGPFLDNNEGFDDRVVISGNLEVLSSPEPGRPGRATSGDPWTWGKDLGDIYVAQGFMDLPVTQRCTAQLRARTTPNAVNPDGEVICTDTVSFDVQADTVSTVNVLMYCGLSFQAPVAQLDLAADFSFNVSNFCPDLFVLNCVESFPQPPLPGIPPTTYCETRWRDGDSSCGGTGIQPGDPDGASSCDPQVCDDTAPEGVRCAPAPGAVDPPVTTTVTCDANGLIDCEGDFAFDGFCSWTEDQTGSVGAGIPVPVLLGGPGPLPGGFFVACNPGAPPGSDVTCTAVTTDGDFDCNKTKTVTFTCPGLNFCDQVTPGDNLTDCSDGNECTTDSCDRGAGVCVNDNVPPGGGNNCDSDPGPGVSPGECDGNGVCGPFGCLTDSDCDSSATPCLVAPPGACDTTTGLCAPEVPGNDGDPCDSGVGSGTGTCGGGTCNSSDECFVDAECIVDPLDCTNEFCDTTGASWQCDSALAPVGDPCTPPAGGACTAAGACEVPPVIANCSGTSNWRALPKLCTQGIFDPTSVTFECCSGVGTPPGTDENGDECLGNALTATDVPGGGIANGSSDPDSVVRGCAVPSLALAGQLATDVFMDVTASSTGDGNLTTSYSVIAVNGSLGTAAGIAELVDLSVLTSITSANPAGVTNVLNETFYNTPLGDYVTGGDTLTLTACVPVNPDDPSQGCTSGQVNDNTEAVVPTSSPTVAINFSRTFLMQLFLTTALQPLDISGANCVFDNPEGVCRNSDFGAADGVACSMAGGDQCAALNGDCEDTSGPDIVCDVQ